MRNIKNKKGFTLVELLAVIVVLAIIMIIAVPAVMNAMNDARKNSFKIYAQKVLNTAETNYQANLLTGTTINNCYTITDLMGDSVGNYKGYVQIDNSVIDSPVFTITISDNNYSYTAKTFSALTTDDTNLKNADSNITNTCPSA